MFLLLEDERQDGSRRRDASVAGAELIGYGKIPKYIRGGRNSEVLVQACVQEKPRGWA